MVDSTRTRRVRYCFFICLACLIVFPVLSIVLGLKVHPKEFEFSPDVSRHSVNRTISLLADLVTADTKQRTLTLDWFPINDTCVDPTCSEANIFFDDNLIQQGQDSGSNTSMANDNNRPTDPIFTWNVTGYNDILSDAAVFRTEITLFSTRVSGGHLSSELYYPFDSYSGVVFAFAQDATTNASISLSLTMTEGIAVALKTTAEVSDAELQDRLPQGVVLITITTQRATLVKIYCIVITLIFWIITLMLLFVAIMSVVCGFKQRVEILVVPVSTVFAFTQLRQTMPGAPEAFGSILDFVGLFPCLSLLSLSAALTIGVFLLVDPEQGEGRRDRKLTWDVLLESLAWHPKKRGKETREINA